MKTAAVVAGTVWIAWIAWFARTAWIAWIASEVAVQAYRTSEAGLG